MTGNSELLNFIYQNSQMGVTTIEQLLTIVENKAFKNQLESQYREYLEIHQAAKELLNNHGVDEKGIGIIEKIKTYCMINMQTLTDKTAAHIAEMLIVGSTMGVIDAIKNIRKYSQAEPDILDLMKKLLLFEETNIQQLKVYL